MNNSKANIIAQLQKDMLPLQGIKYSLNNPVLDIALGPIRYAFPYGSFPLGAVHEFVCETKEDVAATMGFIAGILSILMKAAGVSVWINTLNDIFPPAIKSFGIEPDKIIFIDIQNGKDLQWTIEESLRCGAITSVIGEMKGLGFTASRRFQLAVEQSQVTGFIVLSCPHKLRTTSSVSRWKISPLPSRIPAEMPGIGFPCWNVQLLKIRNGIPGCWQVQWESGCFKHIYKSDAIMNNKHKKTG
jgi:protein ImuA